MENVNNRYFDDLNTHFWRKSIDQDIENDVRVKQTNFKYEIIHKKIIFYKFFIPFHRKKLTLNNLNGIKVESFMRTDKEQILLGKSYFSVRFLLL